MPLTKTSNNFFVNQNIKNEERYFIYSDNSNKRDIYYKFNGKTLDFLLSSLNHNKAWVRSSINSTFLLDFAYFGLKEIPKEKFVLLN